MTSCLISLRTLYLPLHAMYNFVTVWQRRSLQVSGATFLSVFSRLSIFEGSEGTINAIKLWSSLPDPMTRTGAAGHKKYIGACLDNRGLSRRTEVAAPALFTKGGTGCVALELLL